MKQNLRLLTCQGSQYLARFLKTVTIILAVGISLLTFTWTDGMYLAIVNEDNPVRMKNNIAFLHCVITTTVFYLQERALAAV